MASACNKSGEASETRQHIGEPRAENVKVADDSNDLAVYRNDTCLLRSRSTASSEMGGEACSVCGREMSILKRDSSTSVPHPEESRACTSTNELVRTFLQPRDDGGHISVNVTPERIPTSAAAHSNIEASLELTTMQLTAETWRRTAKSQKKVVSAGTLVNSSRGPQPPAQIGSSRPKRPRRNAERRWETPELAEGVSCGRSEDATLRSEEGESTTASSSRRSSGLSQVEGKTKCLEELVGHVEEELAEQHVRFDCLQSFCEVVADGDYEFLPFACVPEISASQDRNTDAEALRRCWCRAAATFPNDERRRNRRLNQLQEFLCNSGVFVVASSGASGVPSRGVFHENTVSGKLQFLRDSTGKCNGRVSSGVKGQTNSVSKDAGGTVIFVIAAAASTVRDLEDFSRPAEGPTCVSCGRPMSCSRCYTKTAMSVVGVSLHRPDDISQALAKTGPSPDNRHVCGADDSECAHLLVVEGDNWETGCFLNAGACERCARNIYCLTCLGHMKEQTAGLREVVHERELQVPQGHKADEHRESAEFRKLSVFTAMLPRRSSASGPSGAREKKLQVRVRLPDAAHNEGMSPVFIPSDAGSWLGCRLVGIHDMAERYAVRARDYCPATIDQANDTLSSINYTRALRDGGHAREASLSDCEEPDHVASLRRVGGGVQPQPLGLTPAATGNTRFLSVRGIADVQLAQGKSRKRKSEISMYPALKATKNKALRLEGSLALQPWRRLHAATIPTSGPFAGNINAVPLTDAEDVTGPGMDGICTSETTSCAHHRQYPSISYATAGEGKHGCSNVMPVLVSLRGLDCKNRVGHSGRALQLRSWEPARFNLECWRACSREQTVRRVEAPATSSARGNRSSYDRCFGEKSHQLFFSLGEKRDNGLRESCSAATRFSLMHQEGFDGAVLTQRRRQANVPANAETDESCPALHDSTLLSPDSDPEKLFQVPRTTECSQHPHHVARRESKVTVFSAETRHQAEARGRASTSSYMVGEDFSARLRWRQDGRPLQTSIAGGFRSSSSLQFSSPVLRAGSPSAGFLEERVWASTDFEKQPVLLGRNAWLRASCSLPFTAGERAGANVETPDTHAVSVSAQEYHKGKVTRACSVILSPPDAEEENAGEESTYAGDDEGAAPSRVTTQTETRIGWDKSHSVNANGFCQQQFYHATRDASVSLSRQICGKHTSEVQCDRLHWTHKRSFQQSEPVLLLDCVIPGSRPLQCMVPLRVYGEQKEQRKKKDFRGEERNEQREKGSPGEEVVDSVAVVTLSRNTDDLDSSRTTDMPSLIDGWSDTTQTPRPAVLDGNRLKRGQGLMAHECEMGQQERAAAASEFKHGSSICSAAAGRSTTVALSERIMKTVLYCPYNREKSPNVKQQENPDSAQDGQERKSRQSYALGVPGPHYLEHPFRVLAVPAAAQEEPFTCSWSARLAAASVSIESTISTASQDSSYDHSTFRTTSSCSRSGQLDIGSLGGAPQAAVHAVWDSGSCTSRVQEESDRMPKDCQSGPPTASSGRHESDLAQPPLPAPLVAFEPASKSHGRQPSGTYAVAAPDLASLLAGKRCDDKASDVGPEAPQPHAVANDPAAPPSRAVDVRTCRPLLPHKPCLTRGYGGGGHTAGEKSGLVAGAVPGRELDWPQTGTRIRQGGHPLQETVESKEQARFDEQLINSWTSWREEIALRPCQSAAVAPGWKSSIPKTPDTVAADALPQGPSVPDAENPGAVLLPIGSPHRSAPSRYSEALAIPDGRVQTDSEDSPCLVTSEKCYAAGPADDEEKGWAAGVWRECNTPQNFTGTAASPHSPRKLRRERKGMAQRRDNTIQEGHKPVESEKLTVTGITEYQRGKGEQEEKEEPEHFVMRKEPVTSSTVSGALQNLHSMRRTKKSAATGGNTADRGCQKKFLNVSRMAGGRTHPPFCCNVSKRGRSVNGAGAGFLGNVTTPTAAEDADGLACPSALLTELCNVRGEPRRRTLPENPTQTNTEKARTNRVARRTRKESELSVIETRKSWRTDEDGKIIYDAYGHKISGVWFDNGRRLWRVVFTQGERRRTKGFSLKQYGFEQARNLAVQCKLAIDARKALCKDDTAEKCSQPDRVLSKDASC